GQPMAEYLMPVWAREDHYRGMQHYRKTGEGEILGKHIELTALNKQKEEVDVEAAIVPIEVDGGVYFTAFLRDITQRKDSERLILEAKEVAESASKAKSDFLAVLSHEIRTPINAILGSITILREMEHTEQQVRYLKMADEAGNSLLSLVNDILDFSKIEAGKLELESVEFDPVQLTEETVGIMAHRAFEKGIEIACCIDENLPSIIQPDQAKLRQILLNLLSNALKFTSEGGILVKVEMVGEKLRYIVIDSGIGIAADKLGKLFDQFSQEDSSTQRKYGGTGLGLAISSRIADLLGGEMGVESVQGSGSQFWVTIQPDLIVKHRPSNQKLKSEHAVIHESNLMTQRALAIQLQNMGVSVEIKPQESGEPSRVVFSGAGEEWQYTLTHDKPSATDHNFLYKPVRYDELQRAANGDATSIFNVQLESEQQWQAGSKRRLLLAEDSQANQVVATTFLNSAGYDVDVAANGIEALDAARNFNYDLILMDVSMPEMDGIEATKQIRKLPGQNGKVPIIALTANVFKDDVERCYDAGMNGFIPKPIEKKRLLKSIGELLADNEVRDSVSESREPENCLDHQVIDQLIKDVGEEMIPIIMGAFFKEIHRRCHSIDELLKTKNIEQIGEEAHAMKSSSSGLGAIRLSHAAKDVEYANREARSEDVLELAAHLKPLAMQCLQELRERFKLDFE
ncbi:MAG: response regulator, partial [Pseudohongiellaceae bacterium]